MSLEEWFTELFKYATGWLGYTVSEALETHIAALVLAMEGHHEMVMAVHYKKPPKKRGKKKWEDWWMGWIKDHNKRKARERSTR